MKNFKMLIIMLMVTTTSAFAQKCDVAGAKALDFKLKNVDEKMVSLEDFKDAKGFIVIFTCNHCPFSKAYEDRIIDLHNKYASKGYPVIAINPNDSKLEPEDSFENMQKRAADKKFPFV